jgi:hypothetical protein
MQSFACLRADLVRVSASGVSARSSEQIARTVRRADAAAAAAAAAAAQASRAKHSASCWGWQALNPCRLGHELAGAQLSTCMGRHAGQYKHVFMYMYVFVCIVMYMLYSIWYYLHAYMYMYV